MKKAKTYIKIVPSVKAIKLYDNHQEKLISTKVIPGDVTMFREGIRCTR